VPLWWQHWFFVKLLFIFKTGLPGRSRMGPPGPAGPRGSRGPRGPRGPKGSAGKCSREDCRSAQRFRRSAHANERLSDERHHAVSNILTKADSWWPWKWPFEITHLLFWKMQRFFANFSRQFTLFFQVFFSKPVYCCEQNKHFHR